MEVRRPVSGASSPPSHHTPALSHSLSLPSWAHLGCLGWPGTTASLLQGHPLANRVASRPSLMQRAILGAAAAMVAAWLAWLLAAACDMTKACLANSIAIRLAAHNLQPRSHAKSHCLFTAHALGNTDCVFHHLRPHVLLLFPPLCVLCGIPEALASPSRPETALVCDQLDTTHVDPTECLPVSDSYSPAISARTRRPPFRSIPHRKRETRIPHL
ncbi:hypothetical protein BGZ61DRAFT_200728 [Ilyonectria robusta]|uniref:uncharacterized protein n=1 Tax=Ilyonectria robusta TaxID=1079257 RepID=UPI001E8DBBAE|nr:uncharacterized protein BGZ61DRAFT_200728 [Ilyonectria robusta]KAH8722147.1 hypothetical protein BGZ61DRAFT_200728 [Ilyonectria robusta]